VASILWRSGAACVLKAASGRHRKRLPAARRTVTGLSLLLARRSLRPRRAGLELRLGPLRRLVRGESLKKPAVETSPRRGQRRRYRRTGRRQQACAADAGASAQAARLRDCTSINHRRAAFNRFRNNAPPQFIPSIRYRTKLARLYRGTVGLVGQLPLGDNHRWLGERNVHAQADPQPQTGGMRATRSAIRCVPQGLSGHA
jgi:hypothetical protein